MKVALFMMKGHGYLTQSGVHFSDEEPFQLVEDWEVEGLRETGRFREATKSEIRAYYNI